MRSHSIAQLIARQTNTRRVLRARGAFIPGTKLAHQDQLNAAQIFGESGTLHRQGVPTEGIRFLAGRYHDDLKHPRGWGTNRIITRWKMMFHHDMIHREIPDKATLLYAVEIPSAVTWFASGYAAYESSEE